LINRRFNEGGGRGVRRGRRASSQRGVALLLAMSAVAIAAVVGVGLLAGLPATTRASTQQAVRDAAVYLAESGVEEGLYRLRHPPAGDPDWTGVTGRRVDGMGGVYDVAIEEAEGGLVRITGTGRFTPGDGRTVEHRVSMTVRVESAAAEMTMRHVGLMGTNSVIPDFAQFHGDVHVNGLGINYGHVHGRFSAESVALNLGYARSRRHFAGEASMPEVDVDAYRSYRHDGESGSAWIIPPADLASEGRELDAVSSENPLGVVVVDGDLDLQQDLRIREGILVVNGDLRMNGRDIRVRGRSGQLALIVRGRADFNWSRSRLRVERGTAYIGGAVRSWGHGRSSRLDAQEGLIVAGGFPSDFAGHIDVRFSQVKQGGAYGVSYFAGRAGGDRVVRKVGYRGRPGE
jgi:hypothetical protein